MKLNVTFTTSKTNKTICQWNSQFIHSSYDPLKEAMRFVESVNFTKEPKYLIFLAPFGGFCHSFLKEKFPDTQIITIEFFNHEKFQKNTWDYCFSLESPDLSHTLFSIIGEEDSRFTETIIWPTSERLFPNESKQTLEILRVFFTTARDVLGTRLYFTPKWNSNTLRNIRLAQHIVLPFSTDKPVCIIASGPSLQKSIPFLKKYKDSIVLLALSSSLSVLVENNIEPDLCLTTDGGFWAKMHLETYAKKLVNTVFIASLESALPYSVLKYNLVHFIDYGDGFSNQLIQKISLRTLSGLRSGSVSGTAISLGEAITGKPLLFLGLDLSFTRGLSHSQPNALELYNAPSDRRLRTKEDRITKSNFAGQGSLKIYENWFRTRQKSKNTIVRFRPEEYNYLNVFPNIPDVSEKEAEKLILQNTNGKPKSIIIKKQTYNKKTLHNFLTQTKQTLTYCTSYYKGSTDELPISTDILYILKEIALKEYLDFQKDNSQSNFDTLIEKSIQFFEHSLNTVE